MAGSLRSAEAGQEQLPRVAIVGRPNVGKSTLFNRLVGRRRAIVDDTPGVTRDVREAPAQLGDLAFALLDTAGWETTGGQALEARMRRFTERAIDSADAVLFLIDARAGIVPLDESFAGWLRKRAAKVILVANKCEGRAGQQGLAEAHGLGLGEPIPVSAEHGEGLSDLHEALARFIEPMAEEEEEPLEGESESDEAAAKRPMLLAIVGRPNVGKSTLVNRLIGEERVLTGPEAGITRDAGFRPGQHALLADQAIDQGRLADIGAADDRQEHGPLGGRLVALALPLERFLLLLGHRLDEARQRLVQVAQAFAVLGRDRDRLAQPQSMRLGQPLLAGAALAFIGDQDYLAGPLAQPGGKALVERQYARARIDQEQHDVGTVDGTLGEATHARLQRLAAGRLPARGIEQREGKIAQLRRGLAHVAGHARRVVDDGAAATDQTVEQRRLADIGPADDGDFLAGLCGRHGWPPGLSAARSDGRSRSADRWCGWRSPAPAGPNRAPPSCPAVLRCRAKWPRDHPACPRSAGDRLPAPGPTRGPACAACRPGIG